MKIKGLTLEQIEKCAKEAGHFRLDNIRPEGNYTLFVLRMASGTPRTCGNVTTETIGGFVPGVECTRPRGHDGQHWHRDETRKIVLTWYGGQDNPAMRYRKRGIGNMMWGRGPEYGTAVCFHGFKEFMDHIFDLNPQAIIRTSKAAYLGREDFEAKYPDVANQNVGSQVCPVAYGECCDCYGG